MWRDFWRLWPKKQATEAYFEVPPFIQRLPNELLLDIFSHCIPTLQVIQPTPTDLKHTLHPDVLPWSLARVCHRWRELVIASPELWSTIILPWGASSSQVDMAILQLERSLNHPLSFSLLPCDPSSEQRLFNALFQHSTRWKMAHISRGSGMFIDIPSSLSFPQLEAFSSHTQLCALLPPFEPTYFPKLHSISLFDTAVLLSTPPSPIGPGLAAQITHLSFSNLEHNQTLSLLEVCGPFLRSLEIKYPMNVLPTATHIPLPRLRKLCIANGPSDSPLSDIFDLVKCPTLEHFIAIGQPFDPHTPPAFSSLKTVELVWAPDSTWLIPFLTSTQQLEHVRIQVHHEGDLGNDDDYYIVERIFELLRTQTICPKLCYIALLNLPSHPRIIHQVIGFIQLVRARAEGLRHVYMSAQNYEIRYNPLTEGIADAVREKLKKSVKQIRMDHPHLDLQISYRFDTEMMEGRKGKRQGSRHLRRRAETW